MDFFDGMKEKDANLKAHNCALSAFCTMPLFEEDFKEYKKNGGKLEEKIKAATKNDKNVEKAEVKIVEKKFKHALKDHNKRWKKINNDRVKSVKKIFKSLDCDVECVADCLHPHKSYNKHHDKHHDKNH